MLADEATALPRSFVIASGIPLTSLSLPVRLVTEKFLLKRLVYEMDCRGEMFLLDVPDPQADSSSYRPAIGSS